MGGLLLLDWLDPQFNSLADPVSHLAARGTRYFLPANLLLALSGLLLAGFTWGLYCSLRPVALAWQPLLCIGLFGLVGLLGAALLPCDPDCNPVTVISELHYLPALFGASFLALGLLALPLHLGVDPRWSACAAWPPRLLAVIALLGILFHLGGSHSVPALNPFIGLFQRLLFAALFAAVFLAARRLHYLESS